MLPLLISHAAVLQVVDDHVVLPDGATLRIADGLHLGDPILDEPAAPPRAKGAAARCAASLHLPVAAQGPGWVVLAGGPLVVRATLPGCQPVAATDVSFMAEAWGTRGEELFGADHDGVVRLRLADLATLSLSRPRTEATGWDLSGPTPVLRNEDVRCTVAPVACTVDPRLPPAQVLRPADVRLLNVVGPPWLQVLPKGVQVVDATGHALGVPLPVYAEGGLVALDGSLAVLRQGDAVTIWEVGTGRQLGALPPELEGEVVDLGAAGIGVRSGPTELALYDVAGRSTLTASTSDGQRWTVTGALPTPWQGPKPAVGALVQDPVYAALEPGDPVYPHDLPSVVAAPPPTVATDWSPLPVLGEVDTLRTEILLPGRRFERDAVAEAALRASTRDADLYTSRYDGDFDARFPGAQAALVSRGQVFAQGSLAAAVAALPRVGLDRLDFPLPPVRAASGAFTLGKASTHVYAAPDGGAWLGFGGDTVHIDPSGAATQVPGVLVGLAGDDAVLRRDEGTGVPGRWSADLGASRGAGDRLVIDGGVVADSATGAILRTGVAPPDWSERGWAIRLYEETPLTCMRTVDDRSLGCYPAEGAATWVGDTALLVDDDGVLHAWRGGREVWRHTGLVEDQMVAVDSLGALVQAGGPLGPWVLFDASGHALAAWELGEEVSVAGGVAWGAGGTTLRRVEVKP